MRSRKPPVCSGGLDKVVLLARQAAGERSKL